MRTQPTRVYHELGTMQVPYETARKLLSKAILDSKGHFPGFANIPGSDTHAVKWDPGTDGLDGWFEVVENRPPLPSEAGRPAT
jgi:hypothetical protein